MSRNHNEKEVVIVGAGPYGLSSAAFLQGAGINPYVIGKPMSFWKQNMPKGMLLRSELEASNIASPQQRFSMAAYGSAIRTELIEPIPIDDFIAYGSWVQKQVVPDLDTRSVRRISQNGSEFEITLEDGETLVSRFVVLALGIGLFTYRPEQFAHVPSHLAAHSSDVSDLSKFRNKRVAVIGKGQSALEHAALLHEVNADVQVLTRASKLKFLPYPWRRKFFRKLTPGPLTGFSYKVFPPTDLGGIFTSRTIADPDKFKRRSAQAQVRLARSVTRPIGAYWLPNRLRNVSIKTRVNVERVDVVGNGIKLSLSDGTAEHFDYVVLATGYKVDVSKYEVLDSSIRKSLRLEEGYPVLSKGLETSVPGLYMVGVVAEKTLGPTLRFVTGTSNSGPRLAAAITRSQKAKQPHRESKAAT